MDVLIGLATRLGLAAAALAGLTAVYVVGLCIYRRFFHPLARFPGPWLNAVSWWPGVVWTLRGRMPMETRKLHDRYGPVVRLSPDELAFNSPQAWMDIYGHKSGRLDLDKNPIHVGAVDPVPGVSTISMADRANHARQRKALSHGFSKKALWEQEGLLQARIDLLLQRLHVLADAGQPLDIARWYNFLTFDVIGDLSFGESFGCLERGDFHFWIQVIFDAVKAGAIEQASRRLAAPGSWLQLRIQRWLQGNLAAQRADHLSYSREKVMRRLQDSKSDRRDFIYYILKQGEHYDLSQDEVIVNAALFIVAGSETTASAMAAVTYFLLKTPRCYARAQQEVRSTFSAEKDICLASLERLPYLNACIEESMRVYPPTPIGFIRTVQPEGDIFDGHAVPGGTAVSVSTWCASHSAANFRDPDEFVPERWLDDDEAAGRYAADQRTASRPFSLGPRGCIGKDLSYMEQRLTLARVLWNFDLALADAAHEWDTEDNMKNLQAFSTWQKPPLRVVLTDRRAPGSKYWGEKKEGVAA